MRRNDRGYYARINGKSGYVKDGWFTPDDGTSGGMVRRNMDHCIRQTLHEDQLMREDTNRVVRKLTAPLWKLLWFFIKLILIGIILMIVGEML